MDERTERRLVEKAEYVGEAVALLAEKRDELSFDEYRAEREQRDIVEREFETDIEACIDIGEMILRAKGGDVPETNARVFRELGTRSIIDREIAERMAQAAGFRNFSPIDTGTRSTTGTSTTSCRRNSRCSGHTCSRSGRSWGE